MICFHKLELSAAETMPRRVAKLLSTVIKYLIQWVDNQEGIGCHYFVKVLSVFFSGFSRALKTHSKKGALCAVSNRNECEMPH